MPRTRFAAMAAALAAALYLTATTSVHAASPEQALFDQINATRTAHGLPPFRASGALARSARSYSGFMLDHNYFGHLSRIRVAGSWSLLGENIARLSGWRPRPRAVLRAWLRSPPHRRLLLSRAFRLAGVGMAKGRLGGRRTTTWTLHAARR